MVRSLSYLKHILPFSHRFVRWLMSALIQNKLYTHQITAFPCVCIANGFQLNGNVSSLFLLSTPCLLRLSCVPAAGSRSLNNRPRVPFTTSSCMHAKVNFSFIPSYEKIRSGHTHTHPSPVYMLDVCAVVRTSWATRGEGDHLRPTHRAVQTEHPLKHRD